MNIMEKSETNISSSRKIKFKPFKTLFSIREASLATIILITATAMTFLTPGFMTRSNILTTLIGLSMDGIITVAMTIVLVMGGIDLGVGSVLAFASVLAGVLAIKVGLNIWLAVFITLLASVSAGSLVGYFVTRIGLSPFITTLGMMSIARGLAYVLTKGSPLSLGVISPAFDYIGQGSFLGIPNLILILILLVLIFDFLMRRSAVFRQIYYVGSNEKAARLSGINVDRIKFGVYVLSALLSGLAGILTLARFGVATPTAGVGAELRAIAGAVIGGASLSGGEGTIIGALLGVILVALVNDALILLNVSVYWQSLVTGIVLIAAVTIDMLAHHRRTS